MPLKTLNTMINIIGIFETQSDILLEIKNSRQSKIKPQSMS